MQTLILNHEQQALLQSQSHTETVRPISGFRVSNLFTGGNSTLSLGEEIRREIASADEICFMANINPNTLGSNLDNTDFIRIAEASKIVMEKAILAGGTTIRSYTSSLGVTGRFQLELNVHTKVGQPCPVCQTIVLKTKIGGRGTYYCPNCQK